MSAQIIRYQNMPFPPFKQESEHLHPNPEDKSVDPPGHQPGDPQAGPQQAVRGVLYALPFPKGPLCPVLFSRQNGGEDEDGHFFVVLMLDRGFFLGRAVRVDQLLLQIPDKFLLFLSRNRKNKVQRSIIKNGRFYKKITRVPFT